MLELGVSRHGCCFKTVSKHVHYALSCHNKVISLTISSPICQCVQLCCLVSRQSQDPFCCVTVLSQSQHLYVSSCLLSRTAMSYDCRLQTRPVMSWFCLSLYTCLSRLVFVSYYHVLSCLCLKTIS